MKAAAELTPEEARILLLVDDGRLTYRPGHPHYVWNYGAPAQRTATIAEVAVIARLYLDEVLPTLGEQPGVYQVTPGIVGAVLARQLRRATAAAPDDAGALDEAVAGARQWTGRALDLLAERAAAGELSDDEVTARRRLTSAMERLTSAASTLGVLEP